MANAVLEKTLKSADQSGYAAPQVGPGGPTEAQGKVMTSAGSARAAFVLLLIVFAGGAWGWTLSPSMYWTAWVLSLVGFGFGMAIAFSPRNAPILAPIYAVCQGVFLGVISKIYEDAYNGIVIQAVLATASIAFVMYTLYSTGIIKVTPGFRRTVMFATLGICVFYFASILFSLFGATIPLVWDSGPAGIAFSLFVIAIAASNLALDFDFIDQGSSAGLPKYMNWAAGFGLIVTIIWVYLEILRLLAKSRS